MNKQRVNPDEIQKGLLKEIKDKDAIISKLQAGIDTYDIMLTSTKNVLASAVISLGYGMPSFDPDYRELGKTAMMYAADGIYKIAKGRTYYMSVFGVDAALITNWSVKFWYGGKGGSLVLTGAGSVGSGRNVDIGVVCPGTKFDTIEIVCNV